MFTELLVLVCMPFVALPMSPSDASVMAATLSSARVQQMTIWVTTETSDDGMCPSEAGSREAIALRLQGMMIRALLPNQPDCVG